MYVVFSGTDRQISIKITQNAKHITRTLVMKKIKGLRDSFSLKLRICLEKQPNLLEFELGHVILHFDSSSFLNKFEEEIA